MDGHLNDFTRTAASGNIVVLGGGIAGLAAANRVLLTAPRTCVTLVEADDRLGGKIVTESLDGFSIEGGPDSFLATKQRALELCTEVGLGERLQGVTPRRRRAFILYAGRLHDLPEGLTGLVPTRLKPLARSSLLSRTGKARIALDYLLPPRRIEGDESLGKFIRRRLGSEAWERLVEPLMAGIYAADGDTLSLAATFPQLRDAERRHGGLIKGVLASRRREPLPNTAPKSAFLTPIGGLADLVSALEHRIRDGGATIRTGVAATAVIASKSGYLVQLRGGEELTASAVIVATPAHSAAALLAGLDPALSAELAGIPHASTAIVTFAYRREEIPHALDGHGYVIPRIEGGPVLACTWSSRKWAARAPDGWELIRVFIGRSGQDEVLGADDNTLVALAQQELAARIGVTGSPTFSRVHRWSRGMPQYVLGHPERIARIETALAAHPGIYLAGNGYYGVGLPDCIVSGERAGDAAARHVCSAGIEFASRAMHDVLTANPSASTVEY
jgi:oxygen-dependent protoporphyrinogen oxidase